MQVRSKYRYYEDSLKAPPTFFYLAPEQQHNTMSNVGPLCGDGGKGGSHMHIIIISLVSTWLKNKNR